MNAKKLLQLIMNQPIFYYFLYFNSMIKKRILKFKAKLDLFALKHIKFTVNSF